MVPSDYEDIHLCKVLVPVLKITWTHLLTYMYTHFVIETSLIIYCYYNCYILVYRWGCDHEKQAQLVYKTMKQKDHQQFKVEDSGLWLHTEHVHLGASPDGIVNCDCCGRGVLEIKVIVLQYPVCEFINLFLEHYHVFSVMFTV